MRCTDIVSMSLNSASFFAYGFGVFFPPYKTLILYLRFMIWILLISKAIYDCCFLPFLLLGKAGKRNAVPRGCCLGYTTGLKGLPL